MELTQKLRIFPTSQQIGMLWSLSEKCRLLYNFALSERRKDWVIQQEKPKNQRKYISYQDQQNSLPLLKRKYPEYQWVN